MTAYEETTVCVCAVYLHMYMSDEVPMVTMERQQRLRMCYHTLCLPKYRGGMSKKIQRKQSKSTQKRLNESLMKSKNKLFH